MLGILPETFVRGFHDEGVVRKMVYNDLGNTGMKVSKLGVGGAVFSNLFRDDMTFEKCRDILIRALKSGVNYIDTAPFYGTGRSEEILGQILKDVPRKAYYIATKVSRYELDFKQNFSAEKTRESVAQSLNRLNLDYVDIVQIHDADFASTLDILYDETFAVLQEFVKAGKVRHIGITGYILSKLADIVKKTEEKSIKLDTVLNYSRLTMIDYSLQKFIPLFRGHNLGVVNAAANGMGLLTNRGEKKDSPFLPFSDHMKEIVSEARQICIKNDIELGKLAVWHTFQQDGPDTTLVGMDSVEIVDQNIDVLVNGLSSKEKQVYDEVMRLFGTKLKEHEWEKKHVSLGS